MPMPMLVVAAVLEAAMAIPSRTPSVRRIAADGGLSSTVRFMPLLGGRDGRRATNERCAPMKQGCHT